MRVWQIRITGQVQGVGFRPFIYTLAKQFGLVGWVKNDLAGVLVTVQAQDADLQAFLQTLQQRPPPLAKIVSVSVSQLPPPSQSFDDFQIMATDQTFVSVDDSQTFVPVDAHVCEACLAELHDPNDRRFGYPFINCTECGPRFSIIHHLPYDREHTSMAKFVMCEACWAEYHDPNSRRYHAQPIACPDCGCHVFWYRDGEVSLTAEPAIQRCREALKNGDIVAIKSVGGFHLAVDATNEQAVKRLRERKNRPHKPLAILLKNLDNVRQIAHVSPIEAEHLTATGRPIVLLNKRGAMTFESCVAQSAELTVDSIVEPTTKLIAQSVAPHQASIGVMLPSAPLHELLLEDGLTALVMTSGNVAGYPIEFDNTEAIQRLAGVADGWLLNDRDIVMRVDDSVMRCITLPNSLSVAVWLRKGRGYAPYPVTLDFLPLRSDLVMVAYGSQLKNTVGFLQGSQAYISQHIGDLDSPANVDSQHQVLRHLMGLYAVRPNVAVVDAHPEFGKNIGNFSPISQADFANADFPSANFPSANFPNEANVIKVQHHHAHMASCMADNQLTGQTLGVIFDGLGFGGCDDTGTVEPNIADGELWGGEFLLGDYRSVKRVAHLASLPLIGGDKAVHEPIRTAFGLVYEAQLGDCIDKIPSLAMLTTTERTIFTQMLNKNLNTFATTSMGRLFDGVSALLGLCRYSQYEAQAPMMLEDALLYNKQLDNRKFDNNELDNSQFEPSQFALPLLEGYEFELVRQHSDDNFVPLMLDYRPVIVAMVADIMAQQSVAVISHKFHSAVVRAVGMVCQAIQTQVGVRQVVLSGGVFSNGFLLSNTLQHLQQLGFEAYAHQQVPTGDGGIALGQLAVASQQL
ncbi:MULTISPECIES: carbamoyltransferase HypF [unclassified Moraxella]|uniref:carbamoyltransferase HypF n=1 Tax=unclassified Moraxella TaxID=2685852 RepID=UPI003AF79414